MENVRVYKELVKKYLASRAILISTAHNESNIIIGRSLRHNETIRVRLTASSSLLRLSVLPLQISLEKIPLRSCNLLFKAEIYKKKKKEKKIYETKHIFRQLLFLIKFNINKSEKIYKFCKKKKILFRDIKKFIDLICIILIYRIQQCVTGI